MSKFLMNELEGFEAHGGAELVRALRQWAGFYRGRFFSLGSRERLDRGVAFFEEEALREARFDPKSGSFQVVVEDDPEATVAVRLEGDNLEPVCTCDTFVGGLGSCEHVVALVAFLYRLSQGLSFGLHPPPDEYVAKLVQEMLTNDASTLLSGQAELARRYSATEDAGISVSKGLFPAGLIGEDDDRFVALVFRNAFYEAYWMGDPSDRLPKEVGMLETWDRIEPSRSFFFPSGFGDFLKFTETLLAADAGIRVYVTPFRWIGLSGRFQPIAAARHYSVVRNGRMVREIVGDPAKVDGIPVIDLYPGLTLLANGDLVSFQESGSDLVGSILGHARNAGYVRAFRGGRMTQTETVGLDVFNEESLLIRLPSKDYVAEQNELAVDGKVVLPPNWSDPQKADVVIDIERSKTGDGGAGNYVAEASIQLEVDGFRVPLGAVLRDEILKDIGGGLIDQRLITAKSRRRVLLGALWELFQIEGRSERKEFVDTVADDDSFAQLALRNKARRYLNAFQREWVSPKRGRHLIADPERGWILIEPPGRRLANVLVGLLQLTKWVDGQWPEVKESLRFPLRKDELRAFLSGAGAVAAACGARLTIDALEVEAIPVEVSVDAKLTNDIDWFELTAEVRCGGFTIPPQEWEMLIRGDLLIERDGRILVPQMDQAEAIEALRGLFGNPKKMRKAEKWEDEEPEMRIPRLEILDWLAMRKRGVRLKLPPELETIFDSLESFEGVRRKPVPKTLTASLREYQRRGYEWMVFLYEHRFGACLADDMGLGKTVQAIALLAWRRGRKAKRVGPNLVVVPPSLLFNWQHELEQFCGVLKVAEYHGADREIEAMTDADVILTSYELVRRDIEELSKVRFDIVIFDEAQTLKNLAGERTKAALQLSRRFSLCLTGTPMENHVGEYFSVMNLAIPGLFGDYREFRKRTKEGDLRILERAKPFVLRRTKSAILKELPDKVESDLYLEMTSEQKEIYTRTVAEVRAEVAAAYGQKTQAQAGIVALAALTRLRQVCVSPELLGKPIKGLAPKLEYLVGKIRELVDEGHSALVFSQFVRSLDLVDRAAKEDGLDCLRLDGSVPAQQRKKRVEAFQKGDGAGIFLISLRAGGVGLNLTKAQYVFHLDPWWNPAVENQATDRAHRIGQKETVFVQRLLMRGTVEEKIMELKRRKRAIFDSILGDSKEAKGTVLTRADFDALF